MNYEAYVDGQRYAITRSPEAWSKDGKPSTAASALMCLRAVSLSNDIVSASSRIEDDCSSANSLRAIRKILVEIEACDRQGQLREVVRFLRCTLFPSPRLQNKFICHDERRCGQERRVESQRSVELFRECDGHIEMLPHVRKTVIRSVNESDYKRGDALCHQQNTIST